MPSGTVFNAIAEHIPAGAKSFLYPITVWDMRVTPMSTPQAAIGAAVGYLAAVWAGQKFMQNRPPVPRAYLKWPSVVHNALLSLGSFLLLYLILEEEVPLARRYGAFGMICNSGMYTPRMVTLYIINYYFKYWELIDTLFLILMKKRLQFLHVYHHMATAVLCYAEIEYRTPMAWIVIALNLAVHVLMYGYYALTTLRIPCPWKQAVTVSQIVQVCRPACGSATNPAVCARPVCVQLCHVQLLHGQVLPVDAARRLLPRPPDGRLVRHRCALQLPGALHSLYVSRNMRPR